MWPFGHKSRGAGDNARADDGLGRRGEKIAREFLKARGMKVLAENYRCPGGEADLIALDVSTLKTLGVETIVFVEVKTRAGDRTVSPLSAVDLDKQRRLRRVAAYYLSSRDTQNFALRFDVAGIVAPPEGEIRIEYVQDAFQ